jgi:hypothetical protein
VLEAEKIIRQWDRRVKGDNGDSGKWNIESLCTGTEGPMWGAGGGRVGKGQGVVQFDSYTLGQWGISKKVVMQLDLSRRKLGRWDSRAVRQRVQ